MPAFLYASSDLACFLILVGFTIAISLCFIFINKHLFFRGLRYKDNVTISSISAVIGIIYGVFIGFICLYLLNNQDHASQATQAEANAASTIFRRAIWLPQPIREKVQAELLEYINTVVNEEWPSMRDFKRINQKGDLIIIKMINDLKGVQPKTHDEDFILQDLLTTSIKELYNARHTRVIMSYITLSNEIWYVIFIGTFLIIAINYAFKANFYLHLFGSIIFAIMAGSMLFLIVTLDRPFQGEFGVRPDSFQEVLELLNTAK